MNDFSCPQFAPSLDVTLEETDNDTLESSLSDCDVDSDEAFSEDFMVASDLSPVDSHIFDAFFLYKREIGLYPLLNSAQEKEYAQKIRKGCDHSRQTMIACNLRLVFPIAAGYNNQGLSFHELIAEGNNGLIKAVEKFDPQRGFRFSTYAKWWIHRCIQMGLYNHKHTIRMPIHIHEKIRGFKRIWQRMEQSLHRKPRISEFVAATGYSQGDVLRIIDLIDCAVCADLFVATDGDGSDFEALLDITPDVHIDDSCTLLQKLQIDSRVDGWLQQLREREFYVLVHWFGFYGYEKETLKEIGQSLGVSKERVRQIKSEGLKRLRSILARQNLSEKNFF